MGGPGSVAMPTRVATRCGGDRAALVPSDTPGAGMGGVTEPSGGGGGWGVGGGCLVEGGVVPVGAAVGGRDVLPPQRLVVILRRGGETMGPLGVMGGGTEG